jgi:hypothetical protein
MAYAREEVLKVIIIYSALPFNSKAIFVSYIVIGNDHRASKEIYFMLKICSCFIAYQNNVLFFCFVIHFIR